MNKNILFVQKVLSVLSQHNIMTFFIASGQRSVPFVKAIDLDKSKYRTFGHYDERSLAYLSLAWNRNNPDNLSALICTSGSALANFYPALLEAHKNHIPLIVLSADRPLSLVESDENQTIDQNGFYKNNIRASWSIPAVSFDGYIFKKISYILYQAHNGPVHLNFPFDTPLIDELNSSAIPTEEDSINYKEINELEYNPDVYTIVIIGALNSNFNFKENHKEIQLFFEKLNCPFYIDITSGIKAHFYSKFQINNINELQNINELKQIIYIGGNLVSSFMDELKNSSQLVENIQLIHIQNKMAFSQKINWPGDIRCIRKNPLYFFKEKICFNYRNHLPVIDIGLSTKPNLNEYNYISILFWVYKYIIKNQAKVFIANSLSCRIMDKWIYYFSQVLNVSSAYPKLFFNRGHSGIEGSIASTVGISIGSTDESQIKVVGIIGDISFLYDINSLELLKKYGQNVKIILLNNHEGGIFRKFTFKHDLISTPQNNNIGQLCNGFNVTHRLFENNLPELDLDNYEEKVIEFSINPQQGF